MKADESQIMSSQGDPGDFRQSILMALCLHRWDQGSGVGFFSLSLIKSKIKTEKQLLRS